MKELPIEKQVCSLEQAKELAELLGDDAPESYWFWKYGNYGNADDEWIVNDFYTDPFSVKGSLPTFCMKYSAYTGDELGALLPKCLNPKEAKRPCIVEKILSVGWSAKHSRHFALYEGTPYSIEGATEAQAKAALAIQGLKEGWIKKQNFHY